MLIRKVKFSDFNQILAISDQGYFEVKGNPDFGDYLRLKKPNSRRKMQWSRYMYGQVNAGNTLFYIAQEEGKIVGFCFVVKKDIPDSEMSHVGVLAIRVDKDWRNRGIGTKLLEHAIKESKGKFEILEVFPFASNTLSKRLYKKLGFERWGIAPGYIKRGKRHIDLEYMSLRL